MNEKIYHIYAKDKCIYHSLTEEEFRETWDMISKFLHVSGVLEMNDLTYEELHINKEVSLNTSH